MKTTNVCNELFDCNRKGCAASNDCSSNDCPCSHIRLKKYIEYGRAELRASHGSSHSGSLVRNILRAVQDEPHITRRDLDKKQNGNVDLAVKIGFMTDCSPLDYSADRLERGVFRTQWKEDEPFNSFINRLFPSQSHPDLSYPEKTGYTECKIKLRATTLIKTLGLNIRATDDIRDHLRLDDRTMILEVFHHVGYLKEQLLRTKDLNDDDDHVRAAIKRKAIPRQVALEILESLQGILFPLSDKKSKQLLRSFVDSGAFDPEILNFEMGAFRHNQEMNLPFFFLTSRLQILARELENPRPRGWLGRHFERRSGARYIMMATMIGVLFAVLLGFLSLGVSIFQAYIGWQAWKHPVEH